MITLSGRNTRTRTGYVVTLLEYPRWVIERDVDFTNCHLNGGFDKADRQCRSCHFGKPCRWLHQNGTPPRPDAPLTELLQALAAAVEYLRTAGQCDTDQDKDCECDDCQWLQEALGFLRRNRRRS